MVEVFKTNVTHRDHANWLIDMIHQNFADYKANFDLDDCDKILRVKSTSGRVECATLIELLNDFGFTAHVLEDNPPFNMPHMLEHQKAVL